MIDIETLGTTAGSPVVTIGAVLFDPFKCDTSECLVQRAINIRVDISDSVNLSLGVDGNTIRWWFEQEDEAIKALVGDDCIPMKEALLKLRRYCTDRGRHVSEEFFDDLHKMPKASTFWAKDPDFDMQLLRYYYEHPDMKVPLPWDFWDCMSVRTIQALAWPEGKEARPVFKVAGVAHDARWDAITQAMQIQAGMLRMKLSHDEAQYSKYVPPAKEAK
jgi:exodeoxyribonuclease VIII